MLKSSFRKIYKNMYETTKMQKARPKQDVISNIISLNEAVAPHSNLADTQSAMHQLHILA